MGVLVRVVWVALVVVSMWVMTLGLWARVYFEPTGDALAEARRGALLIAASTAALLMLSGVAYAVMRAPGWVAAMLAAAGLLCAVAALITTAGVVVLLVVYPMTLASMIAAVLWPRDRRRPSLG